MFWELIPSKPLSLSIYRALILLPYQCLTYIRTGTSNVSFKTLAHLSCKPLALTRDLTVHSWGSFSPLLLSTSYTGSHPISSLFVQVSQHTQSIPISYSIHNPVQVIAEPFFFTISFLKTPTTSSHSFLLHSMYPTNLQFRE